VTEISKPDDDLLAVAGRSADGQRLAAEQTEAAARYPGLIRAIVLAMAAVLTLLLGATITEGTRFAFDRTVLIPLVAVTTGLLLLRRNRLTAALLVGCAEAAARCRSTFSSSCSAGPGRS